MKVLGLVNEDIQITSKNMVELIKINNTMKERVIKMLKDKY